MKKIILAAICIILLSTLANAITVYERSFSEMGYSNLNIDSPNTVSCTTLNFIIPSDVNANAKENFVILSLNASFTPVKSQAAGIDVNLNGTELGKVKSTDLICIDMQCKDGAANCPSECWARMKISKEQMNSATNKLDICLKTSNTTPIAELKSSSKIGVYKTADFTDSFTTTAEKKSLVIGDKTKITVVIHNVGSAPAAVDVKYARPIAEEKDAFVVVDGKAYGNGTLEPGKQLTLEYTVKPRVLGNITFPPAVAYYTNEFGEQEAIFSSLETINVREPEKKIDAFIAKEKETSIVGEKARIQLNIKNNGRDPLYDIIAALTLPKELQSGIKEQEISQIMPGETETLDFTIETTTAGQYNIGCAILPKAFDSVYANCETSKIVFEGTALRPEIIAAIILVIIGVCVYIYIMKSK